MKLSKTKILIVFSFLGFIANSQNLTKIRGKVSDAKTGKPMPFVFVGFANTPIGTMSDEKGIFFLSAQGKIDSVIFNYVGYKEKKLAIKRGKYQELNILLEPDNNALEEVIVYAGENPAYAMMRKIIKNKKKNNPKNINSYKCKFYNKTIISAYNIDDKTMHRIFKKNSSAINNLDTSEISGKPCLPIYFAETFSDYSYKRHPEAKKEIIKMYKTNTIGLDHVDIAEYTGNLSIKTNLYDNFILIFGRSFVSPLSATWKLSYEYYLIDSTYINNKYCYHIKFKPRRKFENNFVGDFWVNDTTFAIVKIRARTSSTANLNFANDIQIEQNYKQINDSLWFVWKSKQYVDFNLSGKKAGEAGVLGIVGERTLVYDKIKINPKFSKKYFLGSTSIDSTETYEIDNSSKWESQRPIKLTQKESKTYKTIDVIKNSPFVKGTEKIIRMFSSGFFNVGKFELGPYFNFYSYNPIEGSRIVLTGRTSREYSNKIMFGGFVGYGTKDKRIKYGANIAYRFNKFPRFAMGASINHDIGQLGVNKKIEFLRENRILTSEDNFFSSALRRRMNYKLSMIDDYEYYIEKEWIRGFKNIVYFNKSIIHKGDSITFCRYDDDTKKFKNKSDNKINISEITLNTRVSFKEELLDLYFRRLSLRTPFPIFNINITYGFFNKLNKKHSYWKANVIMKHKWNIKVLGQLKYVADFGIIRGNLPYTQLELHRGNETWAYWNYGFNMLNYYEFVSDKYINLYAEHHFNGLILGKIPLLRRLQWRATVNARALYGTLTNKHKKIMKFPIGTTQVGKPYFEAGVGVENIFKFLRVEAIWRLNHLNKPGAVPFGIRAKIQISI